jgi:hypothetical protein
MAEPAVFEKVGYVKTVLFVIFTGPDIFPSYN